MIPDEAVKAALIAFSDEVAKVGTSHGAALRAALEAAAPHVAVAAHWSPAYEAANANAADEWSK